MPFAVTYGIEVTLHAAKINKPFVHNIRGSSYLAGGREQGRVLVALEDQVGLPHRDQRL